MITFFCSAKAFRGRTAIQQRNAINSWLRLYPEVEVMLFGTDEGVAEICAGYGLVAVPEVACTELGTPLIFDFHTITPVQVFHQITDVASNPLPYALVVGISQMAGQEPCARGSRARTSTLP